jgi:cation diffusion facilitator CzcD-associated flavoprotein CzcO
VDGEIVVARRRQWTAEEKAALMAEVEAEGGQVSIVAQRHGISKSLLYNLRKLQVDEVWIHEIVRRKILYEQSVFTRRSFTEPHKVKEELLAGVHLGSDYPIERDFTPRYRPWRQRIAFVPDGDFLQAIAAGKASIVTDEIESFTETGIQLKSGKTLDADIIVTATGFHLSVLGDIDFTIDGEPLVFSDTVTYRGMMFTVFRIWPGCSATSGRAGRCAQTLSPTSCAGFSTT